MARTKKTRRRQQVTSLFDASQFVPRSDCGEWSPAWEFMYKQGQLHIWVCYMLIPLILYIAKCEAADTLVEKLKEATLGDIVAQRVVYSLFIGLCGIGHFLDGYLAFHWPAYKFFAVWHATTAAASWAAVFITFKYRARLVVGV